MRRPASSLLVVAAVALGAVPAVPAAPPAADNRAATIGYTTPTAPTTSPAAQTPTAAP